MQACRWFGISRQSYYQALKQAQLRAAQDRLILAWVDAKRRHHPRMGGLKLHHCLASRMRQMGLYRGRDAFFSLLKQHERLVARKKKRPRTTYSGIWRCPNRLAEQEICSPHRAWVGDITYLATQQGFVYLALLTDVYSRFIVGFDLSSSLAHQGCLRALRTALRQTPPERCDQLIHHSDHGFQYTAGPYHQVLLDHGLLPSMGAVGNCYENPIAERVNGILKDEYRLDHLFVDQAQAQRATQEAIWLYNFERPHRSLDLCTPAEIHHNS